MVIKHLNAGSLKKRLNMDNNSHIITPDSILSYQTYNKNEANEMFDDINLLIQKKEKFIVIFHSGYWKNIDFDMNLLSNPKYIFLLKEDKVWQNLKTEFILRANYEEIEKLSKRHMPAQSKLLKEHIRNILSTNNVSISKETIKFAIRKLFSQMYKTCKV